MADEYSTHERAALLVLWSENREMPNPELTKEWRVDLRKEGRDKLNGDGLIRSRVQGRGYWHQLTGKGVRWCVRELAVIEPPARAGALVRVGFAALRRLASHPDVDVLAVMNPGDLETMIRRAYEELSVKPQDWVRLAKLRPKLNGADKADVDETLLQMIKTGLVHLAPDSNRKMLTKDDHDASIRVGSEDKHLMAIEES